MNMAIFWPYS